MFKHRERAQSKNHEAKVVYDADKLQVVGPFGVMRVIGCDIGARNKTFREALKHTRIIERKCYSTLQTRTAKRLAKQPHKDVVRFWKTLDMWDNVLS